MLQIYYFIFYLQIFFIFFGVRDYKHSAQTGRWQLFIILPEKCKSAAEGK